MVDRIDILIHELSHSGLANSAVTLANSLADKNLPTRLVVVGQQKEIPFALHNNLEIKFLGVKRGTNFFTKIAYLVRSYFSVSLYLAHAKTHNLFVWGKEFTVLAQLIRVTLPLRFKLIGVNVTSISAHLYNKGFFSRKFLNFIYKTFLAKADHIIAQSVGMLPELESIYNIDKDKLSVAYPILKSEFFNVNHAQKKYNKILFIGRLTNEKDPYTALEIFIGLDDKKSILQFVGEGSLETPLKATVTELDLAERVLFAGKQDNIIPFLQEADVLILTSMYEGFGMVLAESVACGVPVISFDCPVGPSEIIIDDVNGYLIPQGDIDIFVQKLQQALTKKWDHKKITETANKFHPDIVIKDYIEAINKQFK